MEKQEAVKQAAAKIQLLAEGQQLDETKLSFYIEKLIEDILAYCHRDDFPDALIYTVVDLIMKRLSDEKASSESELSGTRGPLSSIKMDDTEFHFAVNNVDASGCLSDLDFDSIKPKLNLYRKAVSWA